MSKRRTNVDTTDILMSQKPLYGVGEEPPNVIVLDEDDEEDIDDKIQHSNSNIKPNVNVKSSQISRNIKLSSTPTSTLETYHEVGLVDISSDESSDDDIIKALNIKTKSKERDEVHRPELKNNNNDEEYDKYDIDGIFDIPTPNEKKDTPHKNNLKNDISNIISLDDVYDDEFDYFPYTEDFEQIETNDVNNTNKNKENLEINKLLNEFSQPSNSTLNDNHIDIAAIQELEDERLSPLATFISVSDMDFDASNRIKNQFKNGNNPTFNSYSTPTSYSNSYNSSRNNSRRPSNFNNATYNGNNSNNSGVTGYRERANKSRYSNGKYGKRRQSNSRNSGSSSSRYMSNGFTDASSIHSNNNYGKNFVPSNNYYTNDPHFSESDLKSSHNWEGFSRNL